MKNRLIAFFMQKGIHETTEYLETFLRNLLLNEKNELHNRNLHISGLLNEEKVDIQDRKVDIESVLYEKGSDFSVKTTVYIHRLFEEFEFDEVFGRSAVMELLGLKGSGASKLLSNFSVRYCHRCKYAGKWSAYRFPGLIKNLLSYSALELDYYVTLWFMMDSLRGRCQL